MPLTEVSAFKDLSIATGDIADDAITAAKIANAAVTTNEIQNLTIINNDISNSAAIAGSKISPDFGSQDISTSGGITTNGTLRVQSTFPRISLVDDDNDSDYDIRNSNGGFVITDQTNTQRRFLLNDTGHFQFGNTSVASNVDITGNLTIAGTVDGVDIAARDTLFGGLTSSSGVLTNGVTATTQSAGDNSTKIATTAYVDGASVSTEQVQDIVGAMFTGNTETNITATYQDSDGTIDLVASGGGGGGSSSQLTDTNGTVKVEVDTSTIFLKDLVEVRDSIPSIHFKSSDGNTPYGWFKSHSQGIEILQRVANKDIKIRQKGTSEYTKILIRDGLSGNSGTTDVCIGRSMGSIGKPTDLNAFFPFEGGVELYHISGSTGTKKFETTANGITVQGSVTTEDINMSNLNASANEVDNTKGSWTIQEGASDLFLINRVNGKKYKFNLTEIS